MGTVVLRVLIFLKKLRSVEGKRRIAGMVELGVRTPQNGFWWGDKAEKKKREGNVMTLNHGSRIGSKQKMGSRCA